MERARIMNHIAVVVVAGAAAIAPACVSKKEANEARASVYDAEFAVVYSAAVEAVRELYPNFDDDPSTGTIRTAWHQVKYTDVGSDDPKTSQVRDRAAGAGTNSAGGQLGYNPSLAHRINFIRFDVHVAGGRPWRVRVVGAASQLEPGNALPTELRGADQPHWLSGRTDALTIAIHRKLSTVARKAPREVEAPPPPPEKVDVAGDIPTAARDLAAEVVRAIHDRDYDRLRGYLAEDVVWSLGAPGGVDGAMAMWQADPGVFSHIEAAITAGCGSAGDEIACPADASSGAWQARFARRGADWKLAAFIPAE